MHSINIAGGIQSSYISFPAFTSPIVSRECPQAFIYAVPFRFADRPQKLVIHRIARNAVQRVTGNNAGLVPGGKSACDFLHLFLQVAVLVVIRRTVRTFGSRPERSRAEVIVFRKQGVAAGGGFYAIAFGADDVPVMPGKGHSVADIVAACGKSRRAHARHQPHQQAQAEQRG